MKKFRFPLRSVATVRAMRETRAREVFAAAVHSFVSAEERLSEIQKRIADLETILRAERTRSFRPADQAAFNHSYQRELDLAAKAAQVVVQAKEEMERCRRLWLEARRDVRLIETLETKARLQHRIAVEREEQALLDDRATVGAMRAR